MAGAAAELLVPATEEAQLLAEGPGADVPGPGKIQGSVINDDPRVVLFTDFVSRQEVEHLLQLCEGRWERSLVSKGKVSELHGPNTTNCSGTYGEEGVGETRTSSSVHLEFEESYVVERIAARVAAVTGHSLEHVEPLVALRYEPGQFFKMHHDGAMRPATVFVYLTGIEPGAGGTTHFPNLGFEVTPVACTALMWHNRQENGAADYRVQHEAKPVAEGVKYAMNCFVNIRPQRDTSSIVLIPAASVGTEEEAGTAPVECSEESHNES